MPSQNPTSPSKPPEGRNDGGNKENNERRAKIDQKPDLQEPASGFSEMLTKWRDELVRVCRQNPLTALGVAFMAGRMLRRRRRPAKSK